MSSPEGFYAGSVRVLSVLFCVLGIALIVVTLGAGGGPLSTGFLMGVAFTLVGGARLWLAARMEG